MLPVSEGGGSAVLTSSIFAPEGPTTDTPPTLVVVVEASAPVEVAVVLEDEGATAVCGRKNTMPPTISAAIITPILSQSAVEFCIEI